MLLPRPALRADRARLVPARAAGEPVRLAGDDDAVLGVAVPVERDPEPGRVQHRQVGHDERRLVVLERRGVGVRREALGRGVDEVAVRRDGDDVGPVDAVGHVEHGVGGDRGDVLDVEARMGGRLERAERLRPERGARAVIDGELEPVLHVRGERAVDVDRQVARADAGGREPDRGAVRRLHELDGGDRLPGAAGRVLGLVPKRAGVGGADRDRRQRGAGRGGGQDRKREQGHETAKHPACSIGIARPSPLSPMQQRGQTPMLRGAGVVVSPGR